MYIYIHVHINLSAAGRDLLAAPSRSLSFNIIYEEICLRVCVCVTYIYIYI